MRLLIGATVRMAGKEMLLGSVKEALSYEANTFMFYTGAPQNTRRKEISELRVDEAKALMLEKGINIDDVVVHAPYIINLANTIKPETYQLGVDFLRQEIKRVDAIGCRTLVLHPGSHVKAGISAGLDSIVRGLNECLSEEQSCHIALETMAGKGSELGTDFDQLQYIIDHVEKADKLGICLDTCHLNDSGYDIDDFDAILDEVSEKIGLGKILAVHVNDSKNPRGAHKDRHENIGYGTIGFSALNRVVHNKRLEDIPKILETPWYQGQPLYKEEIKMFRQEAFDPTLKEREN